MTNHTEAHRHNGHGNAHGHGDHAYGGHDAHGHESSPLEDILHALSDEAVAEKITVPNRTARESFTVSDHTITDYSAFVNAISGYVQHHHQKVYGTETAIPDAAAFSEAHTALDTVFRNDGGFNHAIELAKQGRFREVVDAIARTLESRATQEYNSLNTTGKIAPNDLATQTKVVEGLFSRLKALDPSLKLGEPAHFAHEYANVVNTYLQLRRTLQEAYGAGGNAHGQNDHGGNGHGGH